MILPVYRRFSTQDISDAPKWLEGVFNPLNVFCEQTVQALNKNLVVGENVQGMKYKIRITASGSTYLTPFSFRYTGGGRPDCVIVGQVVRTDGVRNADGPTLMNWSLNLNTNPYTITVEGITGLEAIGGPFVYDITLLVM